jgi:hypothetical protein
MRYQFGDVVLVPFPFTDQSTTKRRPGVVVRVGNDQSIPQTTNESKTCQSKSHQYALQIVRDLALLLIHLIVTITRLLGPGGLRSVAAESLLVKHQLLILNRSRLPASCSAAPLGHRDQTRHPSELPPGVGQTKVRIAVHSQESWQARSKGTLPGIDRSHH